MGPKPQAPLTIAAKLLDLLGAEHPLRRLNGRGTSDGPARPGTVSPQQGGAGP